MRSTTTVFMLSVSTVAVTPPKYRKACTIEFNSVSTSCRRVNSAYLHPRPAQRQRKSVQPAAAPVAEMPPVHLRLFARRCLEAYERALPAFASPLPHRPLYLRVTAVIAALAHLPEQPAGVMHALLPALPQPGAPGIDLPALRLPLVLPRRSPSGTPTAVYTVGISGSRAISVALQPS